MWVPFIWFRLLSRLLFPLLLTILTIPGIDLIPRSLIMYFTTVFNWKQDPDQNDEHWKKISAKTIGVNYVSRSEHIFFISVRGESPLLCLWMCLWKNACPLYNADTFHQANRQNNHLNTKILDNQIKRLLDN